MSRELPDKPVSATGLSRRNFLQSSASVAAGAAAVAVPVGAVAIVERASAASKTAAPVVAPRVVEASETMNTEPVTAILRSVDGDQVTVLFKTSQMTVKDPVLAQRLLAATRLNDASLTAGRGCSSR